MPADTPTTRLGLYRSDPAGNDLVNYTQDVASNFVKIDAAVGFVSCLSSARPASAWTGMCIRETDTLRYYVYSGAAWLELVSPANLTTFTNEQLVQRAVATNNALRIRGLVADTVDRLAVDASGKHSWGSGAAAADVVLARSGVGVLTVTGSLAMTGVGNVQFIRKTADTGRTVTVVADDPQLTANVIAGATYELSGTLFIATTDTANADFTMGFAAPASSLGYWNVVGQNQGATSDFGGVRAVPTGWGTATRSLGALSTDNASIVVTGILRPVASGVLTLQWCRAGASGTVTLLTDSFMKLTRVA